MQLLLRTSAKQSEATNGPNSDFTPIKEAHSWHLPKRVDLQQERNSDVSGVKWNDCPTDSRADECCLAHEARLRAQVVHSRTFRTVAE